MPESISPEQKRNDFVNMPEDEAYLIFCEKAVRGLGEELAKKHIAHIWGRVEEEEMPVSQAFEELSILAKRRREVLTKTTIEATDPEDRKITNEQRAICIDLIHIARNMPEKFLGNGATAEVYKLKNGLCAKIITNEKTYQENNDVRKEAEFLKDLHDFEVDGVRSPIHKNTISAIDLTSIVMEEIDGVCLRRVLEGKEEMPPSFDVEEYFKSLKKYIKQLHLHGVYHQDLALRNLMVDRNTGKPRVIDFGKSIFKRDIMGEKFDVLEDLAINKDLAGFSAARAEMKDWINKTNY